LQSQIEGGGMSDELLWDEIATWNERGQIALSKKRG
jgi:hypothetical protein